MEWLDTVHNLQEAIDNVTLVYGLYPRFNLFLSRISYFNAHFMFTWF